MTVRSDTQAGPGAGTRAAPAEPGRARSRPPRPAVGTGRTTARRPVTDRPGPGRPVPGRPVPGRAVPGRGLTGRPVTTRPAPGRAGSTGAEGGLRRVAGGAAHTPSRTSFILLVVGLLGGGLLSLLIINTTLAAGSYQISNLQQSAAAQSQQIATLSQQVASDRSDSTIEREALQLGMVQPPLSNFVDLKTGRIASQPSTDPGIPIERGWVP